MGNTVQGSCSGLLQILNMLLQTKDGYDKELNGSRVHGQHKAPLVKARRGESGLHTG